MACAFVGLLFVQVMYMENMIKMRNEQFAETVKRSLYGVVTMLEQNETKYFLDQDLEEAEAAYSSISPSSTATSSFDYSGDNSLMDSIPDSAPRQLEHPANLGTLKNFNQSYSTRQEILKGQYLYQKGLLNEVILNILSQSSNRPIAERADSATVHDYLQSELEFNGLKLPFEFAVVSRNNGIVYSTAGYAPQSQREVYSQVMGKYYKKDGIVIDIRFNGGGRLHEDIEVLFSGKKYFTQVVRGREACDMPSRRWNKPSIMLQCEACYSNAHGTPWVYSHTGIGKLVGAPVPGTMTSVSWETLQDDSLIFGIPIIGYRLPDGSYLENSQLEPDIYVLNDPATVVKGEDRQLKAAVEELLREIK